MAGRTKTTEQRLRLLVKDIPKKHQDQARELAASIIALEDKLKESREKFWDEDIVIEYDNGGGQEGTRENPAYKAYGSLLSHYQKAIRQLEEMRDDEDKKSMFDWNR